MAITIVLSNKKPRGRRRKLFDNRYLLQHEAHIVALGNHMKYADLPKSKRRHRAIHRLTYLRLRREMNDLWGFDVYR